jgi:hypothetical protein
VGAPVTTIGDLAFSGCTGLESVSLPAATTIGNSAFYICEALATVSLPAATSIGLHAFLNCTALESVSLPAATTIGHAAFHGCTDLATVSLPAATSIDSHAFDFTGTGDLAVTLGSAANLTPPTLGMHMFDGVTSKSVTVKVPSGATGYGVSPTDTTTGCWGNGFRGGGWEESAMTGGTVNGNLTLTVQYAP